MNFTEIEDISKKWGEGLNLGSVFDDLVPISLCLSAQVRFNERYKFDPQHEKQFIRLSIPLVIRVFRESKAYKRNYFVNYKEGVVNPQIHFFKTKWNPPSPHIEDRTNFLDLERDYLAGLEPKITKEIDSLFHDFMSEEITFYGFGLLNDGTLTISFNRGNFLV